MSAGVTGDDTGSPSHGWALVALLLFAAVATLPDLFDAEVLKRASTALLAAIVLLPLLAFTGREALPEWFTSAGARLLLLVTALSLVGSLDHLAEAAVSDRLLTFGLVNIAAVLGVMAARRAPEALGRAVRWATLPVALVAWTQALGWERVFSPGPEEVVALSGNSTLAGALLALGTLAWVIRLTHGGLWSMARAGAARARLEWPPLIALSLVSGALVLTKARGARVAAAVALGVLLVHAGLAAARATRRERNDSATATRAPDAARPARQPESERPLDRRDSHTRGPPASARPTLKPAVLSLVAGIVLAGLVGGTDSLMAHKLEHDGDILAGADLTTNVRLALAQSTTDMVMASPWLGVGLGRFRAEFPPYRDPLEASLPGLAGADTEARHPHNELLLVAAEGGLPAALLALLFVVATLRRAWRLAASGEAAGVLAFLLLLAGTLLALVQDAWTDPATALPVFAAAGFAWARRGDEAERIPQAAEANDGVMRRLPIMIATLLFAAGMALLAWPRLSTELSLRRFFVTAQQADGVIGTESFASLLHAAEIGAGDVDVQRMMAVYGAMYAPQAPTLDEKVAAMQAVDRARERLEVLAPFAH